MIPAAVFTTISDQNVGVVNMCVCVSLKVVTAFMKHVMSHVSGWTVGSELIDAGWSVSNAVWLVAYRMWHWFGMKNIDLEWFLPSVDMEGCIDVRHGSHFKLISPRLCVCVCACGRACVRVCVGRQQCRRLLKCEIVWRFLHCASFSHTSPISHSWQVA